MTTAATPPCAQPYPDCYKNADWSLIPAHCRDGLARYIERGGSVGDFLTALLSNDLKATFERADDINIGRIGDYVRFLYNFAPRGSWGSRDNVAAWQKTGGLQGGAS